MSNPTCFLSDICALKVGDMECMDIVKSEEALEPQDDNQKIDKLKEAHLLLKKKLSLSHELIKQYNDKVKECQAVGRELESVKDNLKKLALKHNSSLSTIMKLELENEAYKQKIEHFTEIVPKQESTIAADKQHLQQLICKVRELERKEMTIERTKKADILKDKVKTLETELKSVKELHKLEIKQMEIKLAKSIRLAEVVKNQKKEIKNSHTKGTCTGNELEPIIVKPKTIEKSTLTNEFYSMKDDPYPLFCSKCMIRLDPVPLDQIFKHMSSCPTMITEVPSPCKESEIIRLHTTPRTHGRTDFSNPEVVASNINNFNQSLDSSDRNSNVSKSDFQRLEQKISSLERKLRKKMKTDIHQGVPNSCCRGFRYPDNCYLGPYPNLFQPGAMIQTQGQLFQYQNGQGDSRNRKRSRKISFEKLNRHATKLRKKRKLDDSTSEWNIDFVPSRELIDSDNGNIHENESEPSNLPLRTESSQSYSSYHTLQALKRCEENDSCPPLRKRKEKKQTTLFSTARSSPPRLPEDMDEEYSKESRNESSETFRVLNKTLSDEEIFQNSKKTPEHVPEYETIECGPKKRRPSKNVSKNEGKASAKNSLVKKIRNLKKNCNKSKPLVSNISSGNNNAKQLAVNSLTKIENAQVSNNKDEYCPVKKHRIAHSARKTESDLVCEGNNRSTFKVNDTNFVNTHSNKDNAEIDTPSKTISTMGKLDNCKTKIDIPERLSEKTWKPVVHENSLSYAADNNSTRLVKIPGRRYLKSDEPVVAGEKIMSCRTDMETGNTPNDVLINRSSDLEDKTINNGEDYPLQPCISIPKKYSDTAGVDELHAENNELEIPEECWINRSTNTDKISINDGRPRTLRSRTKTIKSSDKDSLLKNDSKDLMDKNSEITNSENLSQTSKAEFSEYVDNVHPPESIDNEISDSLDKSEETRNATLDNNKTLPLAVNRKYKRRTRVQVTPVSPMRELRSRSIILSPSKHLVVQNFAEDETNRTNNSMNETSTETAELSVTDGLGPRALFQQLLIRRTNAQKQNRCGKKMVNKKLQQRKGNSVLNELTKLCEDPDWKNELLFATVEKLSKFKTHTIAKCTIDFLIARAEDDEKLDRTHTPPAPLLSKTQQRLLTLLVVLNRTIPNIIQLVQSGIVFRLFRLGHAPEVNVITELTRVFTASARIQKDREKVRILCCDALYCLGLKAMPVIYTSLTSWPEVFPMEGSSSDPLVLCIIDSIMTKTGDMSFPKFFALKKLLTGYYGYESSGYVTNDLAKKFMTTLREKQQNGLDTAIIVLCKQKGPEWAYNNIIQGSLLQMIIQKAHPSIYDAFCLLGNIMRSFPIEDKNGLIKNILEQLCALMESGEGTMQQQEGVATALLSLTRHNPTVVINTLLNWAPSESLSEIMSRNLSGLLNNFSNRWWQNKLSQKKGTKIS